MKLEIEKITGPNCLTLDDGKSVYELIYPELMAGKAVDLDFEGTKVFASPFFNGSIGLLFKDFTSEKLNTLLRVQNLSQNGTTVMRKVIENSRNYYLSKPNQEAVNRAVKSHGEAER